MPRTTMIYCRSNNQKSFLAYDRMLPAQDTSPEGGLGNLIALPLQGMALRRGNSAFVDEKWQPYADQWERLVQTPRLPIEFVHNMVRQWGNAGELGVVSRLENIEECQPWKKCDFELHASDVDGRLRIVDSCMLYVRTDNLKPRICNALRRLSSFRNPVFFRNKAMGLSVNGVSRIIPCYEEDEVYIGIPRGKREMVLTLCREAGIDIDYEDIRNRGRALTVDFEGRLYPEQQHAAEAMLEHDIGILQAATAFGKTAVGAYLIAVRKVNTLVLVHNREILKNWVEDLQKFLHLDEPLPEYTLPSGRVRRRRCHIGRLFAGHCSLGGLVDVAMVTSLGSDDDINPLVREYGMVIMDECHHGAAYQANRVLNRVNAGYVYGLTATPKRDDGMEQKVLMSFGPIRYRYTARQRMESRDVLHYVYPRFTRFCSVGEGLKIQEQYRQLIADGVRNELIVRDVMAAVSSGRTPLVLTKFKAHAECLYNSLMGRIKHLFLLQGGRKNQERDELRNKMQAVPASEDTAIIAIGQYIGEGFNYPRLDTLMLAAPVAWEGNVEQYAGRLHRDYEGKKEVVIYDYVDMRVRVFDNMYAKRLRTYKRIGYQLYTPMTLFREEEESGAFYEGCSYELPLEKDILSASSEIIIASASLNRRGVLWLTSLLKDRAGDAIQVSVFTLAPSVFPEREDEIQHLIAILKEAGIFVQCYSAHHEHFVIIDRRLVWYGNANFLSVRKDSDNVLRMENPEAAAEILCAVTDRGRMQ